MSSSTSSVTSSLVNAMASISIVSTKNDPYFFTKGSENRGDVHDSQGKLICHTTMDISEKAVSELSDVKIEEYKCRHSFELVGARVFFEHEKKKFVVYSNKGVELSMSSYRGSKFNDQFYGECEYIVKKLDKVKSTDYFQTFCNIFLQKEYIYCFALPTDINTRQVSRPSCGYETLRLVSLYDAKTFEQLFTEEKLAFEYKGTKHLLSENIKIPVYKTYKSLSDFTKDLESLSYKDYQGMMIYGNGSSINVFGSEYNDRINLFREFGRVEPLAVSLLRIPDKVKQKLFDSFDYGVGSEVSKKLNTALEMIADSINKRVSGKSAMIPQQMYWVADDMYKDKKTRQDKTHETSQSVRKFLFEKYQVRGNESLDSFISKMIYSTIRAQ
jgi:hypothetical protein